MNLDLIFKLGNLIGSAFVTGAVGGAMLNAWHVPTETIAAISTTAGFGLFIWNGAAVAFTGQSYQLQQVVKDPANVPALVNTVISHKNDPSVQVELVKTAASYPGVDPVQINP